MLFIVIFSGHNKNREFRHVFVELNPSTAWKYCAMHQSRENDEKTFRGNTFL